MQKLCTLVFLTFFRLSFSQATFQWAVQAGGVGSDYGTSISCDQLNNIITVGSFSGSADFDPAFSSFIMNSWGSDIFVCKHNATGVFSWAKDIRAKLYAEAYADATDNSGNIYVIGYFVDSVDFDPGASNFFMRATGPNTYILKLDAAGNFVWAKHLKYTSGSYSNYGNDITTDVSGNVIVTGSFQGTIDFDPGPGTFTMTSAGAEDIYILKLDANGNFIWSKQIGNTGMDYGNCVSTDATDNIILNGIFSGTVDFDPAISTYTLNSASSKDMFVTKFDPSGNFIWAKDIGGSGGVIQPRGISIDNSGDILSTGYFQAGIDFDPGASTYNLSAAASDIFILKLTSAGNFSWAHGLGGANTDAGNAIETDASGNVYVAGDFQLNCDFDPGVSAYTLSTPGFISNPFNLKLDGAGNFVWANSFSGNSNSFANGIALSSTGDVFTSGYFNSMIDFDPSSSSQFNLTSSGLEDVFIQKMNQGPLFVREENEVNHFIFPNPNNGTFYLDTSEKTRELKIFDVTGKEIYDKEIMDNKIEINIGCGIYFFELVSGGESSRGKLVIDK